MRRLLGVVAVATTVLIGLAVPSTGSASADPAGWHKVYDNEFNRYSYPVGAFAGCNHGQCPNARQSRLAGAPDGTPDDSGHCVYEPSRVVSVSDGHLNLHVFTDPVTGRCYGVNLHVRAPSIRYGGYVIRFRADPLPGWHFVVLLWPDDVRHGEIDFPEANLGNPWHGFVHEGAGTGPQDRYVQDLPADGAWHFARLTWDPSGITMELDGRLLTKEGPPVAVPGTPMHLAFHVESDMLGAPKPDPTVAGNVQIDELRLFQRD